MKLKTILMLIMGLISIIYSVSLETCDCIGVDYFVEHLDQYDILVGKPTARVGKNYLFEIDEYYSKYEYGKKINVYVESEQGTACGIVLEEGKTYMIFIVSLADVESIRESFNGNSCNIYPKDYIDNDYPNLSVNQLEYKVPNAEVDLPINYGGRFVGVTGNIINKTLSYGILAVILIVLVTKRKKGNDDL